MTFRFRIPVSACILFRFLIPVSACILFRFQIPVSARIPFRFRITASACMLSQFREPDCFRHSQHPQPIRNLAQIVIAGKLQRRGGIGHGSVSVMVPTIQAGRNLVEHAVAEHGAVPGNHALHQPRSDCHRLKSRAGSRQLLGCSVKKRQRLIV